MSYMVDKIAQNMEKQEAQRALAAARLRATTDADRVNLATASFAYGVQDYGYATRMANGIKPSTQTNSKG